MQVSTISSGLNMANLFATQGQQGMQGMQGPPPPPPLAGTKLSEIDGDSDGSISKDELAGALTSSTQTESDSSGLDDFFDKLDSDGSGLISSAEWDDFQEQAQKMGPPPGGPPPGGPPPLANKSFSDVDSDSDGSITLEEFKSALNADSASSADDERAANLFDKIDTDGDGKISSAEYDAFQEKADKTDSSSSQSSAVSAAIQAFLSQLYQTADSDANGQLSQDEVASWLVQSQSESSVNAVA